MGGQWVATERPLTWATLYLSGKGELKEWHLHSPRLCPLWIHDEVGHFTYLWNICQAGRQLRSTFWVPTLIMSNPNICQLSYRLLPKYLLVRPFFSYTILSFPRCRLGDGSSGSILNVGGWGWSIWLDLWLTFPPKRNPNISMTIYYPILLKIHFQHYLRAIFLEALKNHIQYRNSHIISLSLIITLFT